MGKLEAMLQVSPLSDHKETPPPTKLTTQLDWIVNTAGFIGPGVVTNGQITAMSFTGTDAVLFGVHFGCGGSGPCELVWLFSGDATAQETDDFCSCRLINYSMEVMFYGAFRETEALCNVFVAQSGLSQLCYLLLAACQCADSTNCMIMRLLHRTPLHLITCERHRSSQLDAWGGGIGRQPGRSRYEMGLWISLRLVAGRSTNQ